MMRSRFSSTRRFVSISALMIVCSAAILSPAQQPPLVVELQQTTGYIPQIGAHLGAALAIGDIDGDGIEDTVAGAPLYDLDAKPENADAGLCRILFGNQAIGAAPTRELLIKPPTPQAVAKFCLTAAMGDINGDGFQDIVVGEPKFNVGTNRDVGRIHVYFGSATFNGGTPMTIESPEPTAAGFFGIALATGDLNGDGRDDIIVGTPTVNQEKGKIFYYQGGASVKNPPTLALEAPTPENLSRFGFSLATGDVTGDGIDDLVVGSPYATFQGGTPPQRLTSAGRVYVFIGGRQFDGKTTATIDPSKPELGALFGLSVAVGDVNGDRVGDILISAPDMDVVTRELAADAGQMFVFFGGASPLDTKVDGVFQFGEGSSGQRLLTSAHLGAPVVTGDFNGDKIDDIVAGAVGIGGFRPDQAGRAFVLYGGPNIVKPFDPDAIFPDLIYQLQQDQPFAQFGRVLALGDVNGDLVDDIVFGTPFYDIGSGANTMEDAGELFIAFGFTPVFPTKAKPVGKR